MSPPPSHSVPLSPQLPLTHTLARCCPRPLGPALPGTLPQPGILVCPPFLRSLLQCHRLGELPGPPSLELHPHLIPPLPAPTPALYFPMVLSNRSLPYFVYCPPPSLGKPHEGTDLFPFAWHHKPSPRIIIALCLHNLINVLMIPPALPHPGVYPWAVIVDEYKDRVRNVTKAKRWE